MKGKNQFPAQNFETWGRVNIVIIVFFSHLSYEKGNDYLSGFAVRKFFYSLRSDKQII